ncbi:MAG: tetratricopeptide repeat protein [Bacteroidota bacterium]
MNNKTPEAFLIEVCDHNIAWALNKGFEWFTTAFLPTLKNAGATMTEEHHELLSDCWYVAGDIYDMIGAPNRAIDAYQQSIAFDDSNAAAYRELANMYYNIGKYEQALVFINQSIEIDPDDSEALENMNSIALEVNDPSEPLFAADDVNWIIQERLANMQFDKVIAELKGSDDIYLLQRLACAYGGLGDEEAYLSTWKTITEMQEDFELDYSDWFFMPSDILDGKEIWVMLKSAIQHIQPSVFFHDESLEEDYPQLTAKERKSLIIDYNILAADNKVNELKMLKSKYPKWEVLKEY